MRVLISSYNTSQSILGINTKCFHWHARSPTHNPPGFSYFLRMWKEIKKILRGFKMEESNILDLFGTSLGKPSIVFNSIIRVLLYRLKRLLPRPSSKRGRFINISFLLAYENIVRTSHVITKINKETDCCKSYFSFSFICKMIM